MHRVHLSGSRMQFTMESEIKQKASQSTLIDALIRFSSKRNEENARVCLRVHVRLRITDSVSLRVHTINPLCLSE
jgi:hypothetical protein